jgi:hypothetical protein
MKKYIIILMLFLAQTILMSSVEAHQKHADGKAATAQDGGTARPAKPAATITSTFATRTLPANVSDDSDDDSDSDDEREETVSFPVGSVGVQMQNFIRATQLAYKRLGDEDLENNLEKILFVIRKNKYREVILTPSEKENIFSIKLKDSPIKDTKDATIKLTKKESEGLWKEISKIIHKKKKPKNSGEKGPTLEDDEEDPDYEVEDDDDDDDDKASAKKGLKSQPHGKRPTTNAQKKNNTPQKQQPHKGSFNNQPRYNPHNNRGYNPIRNPSYLGKFQAKPKEIKIAHVVEGTLPKATPQKQEAKQEFYENKILKKHTESRVPEAQSRKTKRIYPTAQNLKHEKRTQKTKRKFEGLKKRDPQPKQKPIVKVEEIHSEEPEGFIIKNTHIIKTWFKDTWHSFINLFNWTK